MYLASSLLMLYLWKTIKLLGFCLNLLYCRRSQQFFALSFCVFFVKKSHHLKESSIHDTSRERNWVFCPTFQALFFIKSNLFLREYETNFRWRTLLQKGCKNEQMYCHIETLFLSAVKRLIGWKALLIADFRIYTNDNAFPEWIFTPIVFRVL